MKNKKPNHKMAFLLIITIACIAALAVIIATKGGEKGPDTIADEKAALEEMQNLVDAQDHFFHRNDRMAASITELGWGGEHKTFGCIIWKNLWDNRGEERTNQIGPYCYYTLAVAEQNGSIDSRAFAIAAIPANADAITHPVLISIIGPVSNSLSFKKDWLFKRISDTALIVKWSERIMAQNAIVIDDYNSINAENSEIFPSLKYEEEHSNALKAVK